MNAALLLLADSRLPAGGHGHSGGVEEAVRIGAIQDLTGLAAFLRGRLATAGLVTAALAAAACEYAALLTIDAPEATPLTAHTPEATPLAADPPSPAPRASADGAGWARLDAEADARISSPAQREASRTQGRLLLRTSRRIWPSPVLDAQAGAVPQGVHHPLALGAVAAVAGCSPAEAALAAAYTSVTAPATAAVRLLGLDPVAVHRLLADLAPALERVAAAPGGPGSWEALPAHAAPALDLLAERHVRADLRLFVS